MVYYGSYPTNRMQFAYVNSTNSNKLNIKFGIAQGSILEPLLFIIFINDLPNVSTFFNYFLFVDDANLVVLYSVCYSL